MERFHTASSSQIEDLILKSKNKNTTKATQNWMRVYYTWAAIRGTKINIAKLPPCQLGNVLQLFLQKLINRMAGNMNQIRWLHFKLPLTDTEKSLDTCILFMTADIFLIKNSI